MKIPKIVIPILAVITVLAGFNLRSAFTRPTTEVQLTEEIGSVKKATAIVDGLKCKGTANFFSYLFNNKEGVYSVVTYASEKKAIISYNPDIITIDGLREIIEQEVPLRNGQTRQVFTCISLK